MSLNCGEEFAKGLVRSLLRPSSKRSKVRHGVLAVEILLLAPVLLTAVVIIVQFALYLSASQRIDEAGARAARIAAQGGNSKEIADVLKGILGIKVYDKLSIDIRYPSGDTGSSANFVEVELCLPVRDIVPDFFSIIGFGWGNTNFHSLNVCLLE